MPVPVVGIIANPVSARDIRRIISHAGSLQITDRANIVLRILAGLAAAGVTDVVMMPENAGIRVHLNRAMMRARNAGEARFPALDFLQMNVTGQAEDSAHAARLMRRMGVAAIVVLGGDGTHRVVVSGCGGVPDRRRLDRHQQCLSGTSRADDYRPGGRARRDRRRAPPASPSSATSGST